MPSPRARINWCLSVRLRHLHLSRGNINKNYVLTDVEIKQYLKKYKLAQQSNNEIKHN